MHLSEYSMYSQLRSTLAVDRVMKSVLSITKARLSDSPSDVVEESS